MGNLNVSHTQFDVKILPQGTFFCFRLLPCILLTQQNEYFIHNTTFSFSLCEQILNKYESNKQKNYI